MRRARLLLASRELAQGGDAEHRDNHDQRNQRNEANFGEHLFHVWGGLPGMGEPVLALVVGRCLAGCPAPSEPLPAIHHPVNLTHESHTGGRTVKLHDAANSCLFAHVPRGLNVYAGGVWLGGGEVTLAKARGFAHCDSMSAVSVVKASSVATAELPQWLANYLNEMLVICDGLVGAIRQEMVLGQVSELKATEYRTRLKMMIGMVRMLHTQTLDPKFPDREFSAMIGGRLAQLDEYWQMFYEPGLSDDEADKVLRGVFPE